MIQQHITGPALRRSSEPFVSRASSMASHPRRRAMSWLSQASARQAQQQRATEQRQQEPSSAAAAAQPQSTPFSSRRYSVSQSRQAPSIGNPNELWRRELAEWEEDRRKRIEAMKKWVEEDPYNAFFGRSNSFLSGAGWSDVSFIPEWVRKELGMVEESPTKATAQAEVKTADKAAEAVKTSPTVYDPISQRMVAEDALRDMNLKASSSTSETDAVEEGLQGYDERVKESETTPVPVEEWLVTEEKVTTDLPGTSTPETEAVADALSAYDEQAKKETKVFKSPEPKSWLVQEGFEDKAGTKFAALSEDLTEAHARTDEWISQFTAPVEAVENVGNAVRDPCSQVPQGLQTSFERELASGISLEAQMMAMNQMPRAIIQDACSQVPQGLQTSYAREVAACKSGQRKTLEQELMEMAAAPKFVINDACPQERKGLQTSFEREVAEAKAGRRKTLAQELAEMAMPTVAVHDECSRVPQGLQTSYAREMAECQQGRQTLEQEIVEKSKPVFGYSDVCSREPVGLRLSAKQQTAEKVNGKEMPKEVLKQANIASAIIVSALVAQKKLAREVEGRVDGGLHGFLGAYEKSKGASCYSFQKDSLEAELAAQNDVCAQQPPSIAKIQTSILTSDTETILDQPAHSTGAAGHRASEASASVEAALPSFEKAEEAVVRSYHILELDPSSSTFSSFTITSPAANVPSTPLSLSHSLSKLGHPNQFLSQLVSLITKYDIVEANGNIVILQERPSPNSPPSLLPETITSQSASPGGFPNHHDFTVASVTPSSATTQMHPPKVAQDSFLPEETYSRCRSEHGHSSRSSRRAGVGHIFQTAIWATAACYLAGVWFETTPRL